MLDGDDEGEQDMSEQVIERVADTLEMRHVRVWFGEHVIASYVADPVAAQRYAEAMDRRYAGLNITNDPVPVDNPNGRPLPPRRIWGSVDPH